MKNEIRLALIFLVAAGLTFFLFYPGIEDGDMLGMVSDAQSAAFNNWQSLFLIWSLHTVHVLAPWVNRRNLIFCVIMTLYWFSQYLICTYHVRGIRNQLLFALLVSCSPICLMLLVCDTKDSLMCVTLLMCYALQLVATYSWRSVSKLFSATLAVLVFGLLIAAALERHNAMIAIIPLCWWVSFCIVRNVVRYRTYSKPTLLVWTISMAVFLVVWQGKSLFERSTCADERYPAQMLMSWDLVNISNLSYDICLPKCTINEHVNLDMDYLRKIYCPYQNDCIFWWPLEANVPTLKFVGDYDDFQTIRIAWMRAIVKHPVEYLNHRLTAMLAMLGLTYQERQICPYAFVDDPNCKNYPDQSEAFLHSGFMRIKQKLGFRLSPEFTEGWPHMFILSAILLLWRSKYIRLKRAELYLIGSAFFYAATMFFLAVNESQRYMTFPICVSTLMFWTITLNARQRWRRPPKVVPKMSRKFARAYVLEKIR